MIDPDYSRYSNHMLWKESGKILTELSNRDEIDYGILDITLNTPEFKDELWKIAEEVLNELSRRDNTTYLVESNHGLEKRL